MSRGRIRTRDGLSRTLAIACQASTAQGMSMNVASMAEVLLRAADGDVERARASVALMPPGAIWEWVLRKFDEHACDELADTERPLAAGGGGR